MGREFFLTEIKNEAKKLKPLGWWQYTLFFVGIIAFIIWHVLQLYIKAI